MADRQEPGGTGSSDVNPPTRPVNFDPDGLYRIVERYAGFGDHHTGTEADRETTQWLVSVLEGLGAAVTLEPFEFELYVVEASLTVDGTAVDQAAVEGAAVDRVPVPIAPLFYSGLGHFEPDRLQVVERDRSVAGPARALDELISAGSTGDPAGRAGLVVAIDGPDDFPVWCNRVPWTGPSDVIVGGRAGVVVPGNWVERVRDSGRLTFSARLEPAVSHNVVATFTGVGGVEAVAGRPGVIVTTPLTGWTPAAGERGTGLATALAMAVDLARDYRVRFVACSGHELDHIGMQHHIERGASDRDSSERFGTDQSQIDRQPVIHLGASVAAVEQLAGGETQLGSERMMLTTAEGPTRADLADLAAEGNWRLVDPTPWPGEGAGWRASGASVLSFVGGFEHFHVASDLPVAATTPEALQRSTDSAIKSARRFLQDAV